MMQSGGAIGIYDSGIGGLTVWRAIRELLPRESLIYLGDGENCPYGLRPREEISSLADRAVGELIERGCKLIVVACNTATAAAIDFLRDKYRDIDIVGMEPAVKPACERSRSRVVGVLATQRSLEGDLFQRTAQRYSEDVKIIARFGEGFVELVEQNRVSGEDAEAVVRRVVEPMLDEGVDQIVLGCTHYPFLIPVLRRIAPDVEIVDPSCAVARRVEQLLKLHNKESRGGDAKYEFLTFADAAYLDRLHRRAMSL